MADGDALQRISHEVRGIPLWLMRAYLEEAGGRVVGDNCVAGDGWAVQLTQVEDFTIGSLRVGQIRLELEATPTGLARILPELEKKLLRAGG